MNARGEIYYMSVGEVCAEDRARLDGYILAREDRDEYLRELLTDEPESLSSRQRRIDAERLRLADDARRRYHRRLH